MSRFYQSSKRFFQSRAYIPSLLSGSAIVLPSYHYTTAFTESSNDPNVSTVEKQVYKPMEFVGIFLDKTSAQELRALYPLKFTLNEVNEDEPLFVVLKYHPTLTDKEAYATLLGEKAKISLKAYIEDTRTQAVIVQVEGKDGDEEITFKCANNDIPHITISSMDGNYGLNAGYTSILLERLRANENLQFLFKEQANTNVIESWSGELPVYESKSLTFFNAFPSVPAKVTPIQGTEQSKVVLHGTVCLSTMFDSQASSCTVPLGEDGEKVECGFCKFMKAGPCGNEFTKWEACLERCKKDGVDFIDHCGVETIALRDCVDANPEYYQVLNEAPQNSDNNAADTETTPDPVEP